MAFIAKATLFLLSVAVTVKNSLSFNQTSGIPGNSVSPHVDIHRDRFMNFTELSGHYGFATEEHTVTTEDGYVLTVFRMTGRDCVEFNKSPVLLMHGLFQSADAWLDAGPDAGLAYLIAAQCHELWVGNQRGNYYGRRHVRLDPDRDAKFWKFSTDEMGIYDIPAIVDYVLKNTRQEKLIYVGFSQAVGTSLIMCSERPGYCDKVSLIIALAPATRITNIKSVMLKTIFETVNKLQGVLLSTGVHELFARGALVQGLLGQLCKFRSTSRTICGTGLGLLDAFHPGSIDDDALQLIATHTPAGTSTQTLVRYGQSLKTDKFQKFDYGKAKNLEIYGTERPPVYNLDAATAPVALFYGLNDNVDDIEDVFWLKNQLPNLVEAIQIADPLWNHFDMIYSRHVKKLVYPKVKQYLFNYS
ncbi:lipase 3-like [Bicyclus anynana]|uniref:Lipase n=1 Tax=Bicyclus anynana TaxID=110368 RepID=A0A6J1N9V7_BICAN|nr:lipase 3-like [Bicyclus anynana]